MRLSIHKLFTVGILLALGSNLLGQVRFEGQVGGANFIGLTFNTAFEIPLKEKENRMIIPGFGIGNLRMGWSEDYLILNHSLHYQRNKWGFGYEASFFGGDVFAGLPILDNAFLDLIIYPNANYTFINNWDSKWYAKLSLGLLFVLYYLERPDRLLPLDFDGDVIPGIGITVGTRW